MYVKEYGSGERPFLCFHGWGGDHREFAPLARHAPSQACLLSVDLPGYGHSSAPAKWSLDTIITEAIPILENRNVPACTLVGFCSGAALALMFAARQPEWVKRVVMIDPFAFIPWYFRIFLSGEFGRRAYATTFQTPIGRKITDWILKRVQTADADFTNAFVNLDHEVTLRYLQLLSHVDIHRTFGKIQMDIDLLYGEHTFGAVRRSIEIYRALLPQAKARQLNGVGHLPMITGALQLAGVIFGDPQPAGI
jgi:pimeloyl-ACP methyl ester carboxylesterase